jgi:hypothetical protein
MFSFKHKPSPFPRELTPEQRIDRASEVADHLVSSIARDAVKQGVAAPSDVQRAELHTALMVVVEQAWTNERLDALEKRLAAIDGL